MKDIFTSVRRLTARPDRSRAALTENIPAPLRSALHYFESVNRGHSHLLDKLENPSSYWRSSIGTTVHESLQCLLRNILKVPSNELPELPELDALLDAEDSTGWLKAHTLGFLESHCRHTLKLPDNFSCNHTRLEERTGELAIDLRFEKIPALLSAQRTLLVPIVGPKTLREFRTFMRDAGLRLKHQVADIQKWPEFTEQAREAAIRSRFRADLARLLKGFTHEEQQFITANWHGLTSCLQNPSHG